MTAIQQALRERLQIIEDALLQLGLDGGGLLYVEDFASSMRREGDSIVFETRIWRTPLGAPPPPGLPERHTLRTVPAILRG